MEILKEIKKNVVEIDIFEEKRILRYSVEYNYTD